MFYEVGIGNWKIDVIFFIGLHIARYIENVMAQIIKATDRELYYHTWQKKDIGNEETLEFKPLYLAPIIVGQM